MIGKLHGIIRDMVTGQCLVTFAVNDSARVVEQSAELRDKELNIKATKYHKPRSLDANAYHWALCHKIAHALQTDAKSMIRKKWHTCWTVRLMMHRHWE